MGGFWLIEAFNEHDSLQSDHGSIYQREKETRPPFY